MTNRVVQAYQQAPWRKQVQWIMVFLLALVLVTSVVVLYLTITAQSATTGREIQSMENEQETLRRGIADLNTRLADLTTASIMQDRAEKMGFVLPDPGSATYMTIPGYAGRQAAILAPSARPAMVSAPLIRPSYTQSLWDWLFTDFMKSPILPQVKR